VGRQSPGDGNRGLEALAATLTEVRGDCAAQPNRSATG
jgi:hypothetical protein